MYLLKQQFSPVLAQMMGSIIKENDPQNEVRFFPAGNYHTVSKELFITIFVGEYKPNRRPADLDLALKHAVPYFKEKETLTFN